jgi:hypothetical protein
MEDSNIIKKELFCVLKEIKASSEKNMWSVVIFMLN